jgi:DNA-binding YbaB/EbfC family protein
MMDMFGKFKEIKERMDEIKSRLGTITVEGVSGEGNVTVMMNGNMDVKSVAISDMLITPERKEELEEMVQLAVNRAIEKARNVSETEMKAAGKGILPDIPGLF